MLYLLCTPLGIRIPHVLRWLDGWYILEHHVAKTNNTDGGAGNGTEERFIEYDGTDEDVNWYHSMNLRLSRSGQRGLHIPLPRKLNRNGAHLEMYGGIWNSRSRVASNILSRGPSVDFFGVPTGCKDDNITTNDNTLTIATVRSWRADTQWHIGLTIQEG